MVFSSIISKIKNFIRGSYSTPKEVLDKNLIQVISLLIDIEDYDRILLSKSRKKYNKTLSSKFSEQDLMKILNNKLLPTSFRSNGIKFNKSYKPSPFFEYLGISSPISIRKLYNILTNKLNSHKQKGVMK